MIDFRYHLVSLVAVFIALAVGIALGAGPLREGLSSTLESEVGQLREERTALRDEVDLANRQAEARTEALRRLGPRALEGTLTETRVGLVVLPGADRNVLDRLESRLESAGADIVLAAEVADTWASATPEEDSVVALEQLERTLQVPDPRNGTDATVSTVLAAVLAGADQPRNLGAWLNAAQDLEDLGYVDLTWRDGSVDSFTDRRPPDAVVVISGGLDATTAAEESDGSRELEVRTDLVDGLAQLEVPTVVTGQGGEEAADEEDPLDPLVAAVRDDRGLADQVSTVDNLDEVSGQLAAVMTVGWELEGESGHYGLGRLAQAPVPQVPPSRSATVTVPVPEGGTDGGIGGSSEDDADNGAGEGTDDGDGATDPAGTTSAP